MTIDLTEAKRLLTEFEAAPKESWEEIRDASILLNDAVAELEKIEDDMEERIREDQGYLEWMERKPPLTWTDPL